MTESRFRTENSHLPSTCFWKNNSIQMFCNNKQVLASTYASKAREAVESTQQTVIHVSNQLNNHSDHHLTNYI
jgi:hypothetical protein